MSSVSVWILGLRLWIFLDVSLILHPLQLSKSYGPVMTVYLGPQRAVVLVGYDAVKEALVDRGDDFNGRGQVPFLVRATRGYGNVKFYESQSLMCNWELVLEFYHSFYNCTFSGLVISNGERWRQLRRFTLTTLRDFGMGRKGMEEWIQEESQHLVARIKDTKGLSELLGFLQPFLYWIFVLIVS